MPAVTHIKSKGKKTEYKLEVEDSEAIEKNQRGTKQDEKKFGHSHRRPREMAST